MEIDPHTLQHIIGKISQQMRCPQCGRKVPIDFTSVRIAADDFILLQLKCEMCDAYIVLHASLRVPEGLEAASEQPGISNASSSLKLKDSELDQLREALKQSGGSFEQMFKKYAPQEGSTEGRTEIV